MHIYPTNIGLTSETCILKSPIALKESRGKNDANKLEAIHSFPIINTFSG